MRRLRKHATALLATVALAALSGCGGDDDGLRWSAPALDEPVTVAVSDRAARHDLDPSRDYVIRLPSTPLRKSLWIIGGRNVVLIGGEIAVAWQGADAGFEARYGIFLKNQTGTVHVEGVLVRGPDLAVGIVMDQGEGATVQLQNIRVEDVHGRDRTHCVESHADVLQTWRGPHRLRIDRMTGTTACQGLMLQPHEYGAQELGTWELHRINIRDSRSTSRHLLWKWNEGESWWRERRSDLWIKPSPVAAENGPPAYVYPDRARWEPLRIGDPPDGDFVPEERAGLQYDARE